MVENSSSGIIEAPSFKLPVVNIGSRQDGRLKARNIIDVPYGDGNASGKIARIISEIKLDRELIQKRITY